MTFKEDIINKIKADFGDNSASAFAILENAISKTDDLSSDRVIRCIIFLAEGNMDDLNKYIKAATTDTRDIMLWAEYETSTEKRLRDFDNTFEESSIDINE